MKIEVLFKAGKSPTEIGALLTNSKSRRTIERELARGMTLQKKTLRDSCGLPYTTDFMVYSAEIAQASHESACTAKGAKLKLGNNYELAAFIEHCIISLRLSPYAVSCLILAQMDKFGISLHWRTIYNYIDKEVFLHVSNKDLWEKHKRKRHKYRKVRPAFNHNTGKSIAERPQSVAEREEFGH
jgi:IS30 family transposase